MLVEYIYSTEAARKGGNITTFAKFKSCNDDCAFSPLSLQDTPGTLRELETCLQSFVY